MNSTHKGFELLKEHQELRTQLRQLIDTTEPNVEKLSMKGWVDVTRRLGQRLSCDTFKVLVLGEFKRGKSTFINALLGAHVLPAYSWPCTAVINEIKWGEVQRAVLHFRSPLPNPLPNGLPEVVVRHVRLHSADRVPAMEVPIEDLEKYVVISDPGKDQRESVAETPYERVEIFWPLDLCRDGVEIIDSPGLNEHGIRAKITMDYLNSVDAVVFVFSCLELGSLSELAVIDRELHGAGHEDLFLVCNRFDQIRLGERDGLKKYALSKLAPKTSFGEEGIHFISALDALEGALDGDAARVSRSGIQPLRQKLGEFLANDRGRLKHLQLARELRQIISRALSETIPNQRSMLEQDVRVLQGKYDAIKPQLDLAERRREQIIERVERHRERLRDLVRREALTCIREISSQLPAKAAEFQPKCQLGASDVLAFWQIKEKAAALAKEIGELFEAYVDTTQNEWQRNRLRPLIQESLMDLGKEIQTPIDDLFAGLDKVKADLSGSKGRQALSETEVGNMERVLAGAGGLILGGPGMAFVGAAFGYHEMIKGLLPSIGIMAGMMLFGITNPLLIIGGLVGGGFLHGLLKANGLSSKLKLQIAEETSQQLRNQAADNAEQIAENVYDNTAKLAKLVQTNLQKEIQGVREQVEAVLVDKLAGEDRVNQKLVELASVETEFQGVDNQLSELVFKIATPARR